MTTQLAALIGEGGVVKAHVGYSDYGMFHRDQGDWVLVTEEDPLLDSWDGLDVAFTTTRFTPRWDMAELDGAKLYDRDVPTDEALTAAADVSDHSLVVVALAPQGHPVESIGEEPKHVTVLYLGDVKDKAKVEEVRQAVQELAESGELAGETFGVKKIKPLGDQGAQVWMLDPADKKTMLHEVRDRLFQNETVKELYDNGDFTKYSDYLPHMTITYKSVPKKAKKVKSIPLTRLGVWHGDDQTDYPVGEALTAAKVRTPEGAEHYGQPIGSTIVKDAPKVKARLSSKVKLPDGVTSEYTEEQRGTRKTIRLREDGRSLGSITWRDDGTIHWITRDERSPRKGVGKLLLDLALEREPELRHDTNLTGPGKRFAAKYPLSGKKRKFEPSYPISPTPAVESADELSSLQSKERYENVIDTVLTLLKHDKKRRDKFKAEYDELVESMKDEPIRIRVKSDVLQEIVDGGDKTFGLLNGWENGSGTFGHPIISTGSEEDLHGYWRMRNELERHVFGIDSYPLDTEEQVERPIYGYIESKGFQPGSVTVYGSAEILLKKRVKNRSTVTFGDSLNNFLMPLPLNHLEDKTVEEVLPAFTRYGLRNGYQIRPTFPEDGYAEVQIHGRVTLDDIAQVNLYYNGLEGEERQRQLGAALEQLGIPVDYTALDAGRREHFKPVEDDGEY